MYRSAAGSDCRQLLQKSRRYVVINLLNRDEPARHVLSHSGSKSHESEAAQTMDEQTNYNEVMNNKLTKQGL